MTKKDEQENLIARAYYRAADGVQIRILDVPKIFAAGHKAIKEKRDLDQAIRDVIALLRVN